MSSLRFALAAIGVFALAFAAMAWRGNTWASKSFPLVAAQAEPLKPEPRIAASEPAVEKPIRKGGESVGPLRSKEDKARDKLRIELLQASLGYRLLPCDDIMKQNLVSALTNYLNAWQDMAHCKPGACNGADRALNAAAEAFKTPADVSVHKALAEAFQQGGIGRDDFPRSVRDDIFMWTGMPSGGPQAACVAARSADNRRR